MRSVRFWLGPESACCADAAGFCRVDREWAAGWIVDEGYPVHLLGLLAGRQPLEHVLEHRRGFAGCGIAEAAAACVGADEAGAGGDLELAGQLERKDPGGGSRCSR